MIISPKRFWTAIENGALRPTTPPTWTAAALRSRVSMAVALVPGQPRQETTEKEPGQ